MGQPTKHNTESMQKANHNSVYKLMLVGIVIGVIGTFLRFAADSTMLSIVSWAILLVGTIIAFKAVFKILES